MSKKTKKPIGIIAEDDSDVECVKVLIKRISGRDNIKIHKFVGKGCGKIKRKSNAWAKQLELKGCSTLILIHDLDSNKIPELKKQLSENLAPCPIKNHLICIPVQELESWFLSDPDSIKSSMNLYRSPKVAGLPENINSPKEYLGSLIYNASNKEKIYVNTFDNLKIANIISLTKIKNLCPSFIPFSDFIKEYV